MALSKRSGTGRLRAPFLCLLALPAWADGQATSPPGLHFPVDCSATTCRITRYVDRDPGAGAIDHACGGLTSNGHTGTDIAAAPTDAFGEGVTVTAAAAGTVHGVRDGMPDIEVENPIAPDVSGRECGNGLVIDHGDGWQTQYCHLRRGSLAVRKGERVEAGTPIGQVGMSGKASAPHLHFAFRHKNKVLDPFRTGAGTGCGRGPGKAYWQAVDTIPYRAGGLLQIGVLDRVPEYDEVLAGLARNGLPAEAPDAIVLWGLFFGGQAGDRIELTLSGVTESTLRQSYDLEKDMPMFFRANGIAAPPGGFLPGQHRAKVAHWRGERPLEAREMLFEIR